MLGWRYQNVLHNVELKPIEDCRFVTACSCHTRLPRQSLTPRAVLDQVNLAESEEGAPWELRVGGRGSGWPSGCLLRNRWAHQWIELPFPYFSLLPFFAFFPTIGFFFIFSPTRQTWFLGTQLCSGHFWKECWTQIACQFPYWRLNSKGYFL